MNPYLDDRNFEILKSKLVNTNINFYEGNIFHLIESLPKSYDLINLSSIIYYIKDTYGSSPFLEYLKFLESLPLNDDGIAFTYLYDVLKSSKFIVDYFSYNNVFTDKFEFDDSRYDGVLKYKKRR